MSVRVRGTINIQRKAGRKGDFNIGDLSTEIGAFEVKDALIEQFEPGKYTGEFIIQWIEPDSFSWRGRVFVKNRATLAEILVDEEDVGAPPPSTPPEPDPIDSTDMRAQPSRLHVSKGLDDTHKANGAAGTSLDSAPLQASPPASPGAGSADLALFGQEIHELVQQGQPLKLDPTVDRELFRQQRDRLKALSFAFDAKSQTWAPKGRPTGLAKGASATGSDIPF
jgi:Protein of unknown function (DUF3275)